MSASPTKSSRWTSTGSRPPEKASLHRPRIVVTAAHQIFLVNPHPTHVSGMTQIPSGIRWIDPTSRCERGCALVDHTRRASTRAAFCTLRETSGAGDGGAGAGAGGPTSGTSPCAGAGASSDTGSVMPLNGRHTQLPISRPPTPTGHLQYQDQEPARAGQQMQTRAQAQVLIRAQVR